MKAEETVIKGGVKQVLKINWSNSITGHLLGWQPKLEPSAQEKVDNWIYKIRLEQAEISFPIGKQIGFEIGIEQGKAEGIREEKEKFNQWADERIWDYESLPLGDSLSLRQIREVKVVTLQWAKANLDRLAKEIIGDG